MERKYENLTNEELVKLAQEEEEMAEIFLIKKYKELISAKANNYFIIGAERQDVIQEATIGLYKAIRSYKEGKETSFNTYAELCINRQLISAIKSANRNKHMPLNTSLSLNHTAYDSEDDQTTLGETIEQQWDMGPETMTILKDIVSYINKNEENTFSKLELEVWNEYTLGKSYSEIAMALNKNQKSIYNAMERAKKKILKYLND